ncbi:MAG: transposase [Desulfuromonadaceae bacterium]|nr:transposase [Desulfuromonadaceae bacterium]
MYHVTARGNRQEALFVSDDDREAFLKLLGKVITRYNWICHAYCLMDNHYHLLIETPDANLSAEMRQLNGVYTQMFNRAHGKVNHVFQGRFKSILVEKETHLLELCRYVVLNPVRAHQCTSPEEWQWSSYHATATGREVAEWLTVVWILAWFAEKKAEAQKKYREFAIDPLGLEYSLLQNTVGQIILGGQGFVSRMAPYLMDKTEIKEILRQQRLVGRPCLDELFSGISDKPQRNKAIKKAHLDYGYTLKEIADHIGRHYSTISRVVSGG